MLIKCCLVLGPLLGPSMPLSKRTQMRDPRLLLPMPMKMVEVIANKLWLTLARLVFVSVVS